MSAAFPRFLRRSLWPGAVVLLWLLPGCATIPAGHTDRPVANTVGQGLLDDWLVRSDQNRTLQGLARFKVQTPERTVSGTQVVLAETPGRLRAETLSPFGTPLLIMTVSDAELAVLVTGDSRFYQGPPTPENLSRFTRLPLRPGDLVDILLQRPPVVARQSAATYMLAEGGWKVVLESSRRRQELRFDAERRLVGVSYLSGEEPQLTVVYGDFDGTTRAAPRRIEMALPAQKIQASLAFDDLALNRQFQPEVFRQSAPAGAILMRLDEPAEDR